MIDRMREEYSVIELSEALSVSTSGYYQWRRKKEGVRRGENQLLLTEIHRIHGDRHTRSYGSPRMCVELNVRGVQCSVNRVARLMKQNALKACRGSSYRPKTTQQDPRSLPAPNHLAEAPDPTGPGQIMVSGRNRMGGFQKAIFHSDRGSQYTSRQVRQKLKDYGWIQSMSALGYCYDNAACESFFASLKSECFPQNGVFESKQQARLAIFDYIETFYNKRRRHSSLGYLSPEVFLQKYFQNQNHNPT